MLSPLRDRVGLGDLAETGLLRPILIALSFGAGMFILLQGMGRAVAQTDSPLASGVFVIGLGLALAVFYGLYRNSSAGVLVWLGVSLFTSILADTPLAPIDRAAFAALAAGWFIAVVTGRRPLTRFRLTEALMVLFLLINIVSFLAPHQFPATSNLTATTLITNGVFLPFAIYVIASQSMADIRSIRAMLWFLVWVGFYMSVIAVFQQLNLNNLVFPQAIVDASKGINPERARGPLLNSAADGILMCFSFAAALFLASQQNIRRRRFALAVALLMPIGIFATQTRAIWLGAAIVVIGGTMFASGYRRWYLVVLGAAVAVVVVNYQKFLSADRTQGGVGSTGEIESRLNDWATALWAIAEKPAFGWGIGRFPEINTTYHKAWGSFDWQLGYGFLSHNSHLAIGAELGWLGLIVWTGVFVALVWRTSRAWSVLPRMGLASRGFVFAFYLSLITWLINGAVIDVRVFPVISGVLFMWGGIISGLADKTREEIAAMNEESLPVVEEVGIPAALIGAPSGSSG